MKKLLVLVLVLVCFCLTACQESQPEAEAAEKPVIYLEPEETLDVTVRLDFAGELTCTYPSYNDGWRVKAAPDGTLTDEKGRKYSYLFWEGVAETEYPMDEGFVIAGADTEKFLEEKLAILGLTDKEAGEFITYWLPRMQGNAYNLIAFQTDAYTQVARLEITPQPDSLIRVFMTFTGLDEPVEIPEQTLITPERTGFVVVEWGGAELN